MKEIDVNVSCTVFTKTLLSNSLLKFYIPSYVPNSRLVPLLQPVQDFLPRFLRDFSLVRCEDFVYYLESGLLLNKILSKKIGDTCWNVTKELKE